MERSGLLHREVVDGESRYSLIAPWDQRRRAHPLILLVEDHASIAGMTEAMLTSEGYNVVLARNPIEAHALLRSVAFDVILTDSFSPTLDLAVRVLGPLLRRGAGTPVVLFTAHHWNPARVQAEGFAELITKPFDVEPFLARVEQLAAVHQAS
jgi:CheY-like chemotaxis protein